MIQSTDIDPKTRCCANCKYCQLRTGFCRYNPPQIIQNYIESVGTVTNAVWPKIPYPAIDWCGKFENRHNQLV